MPQLAAIGASRVMGIETEYGISLEGSFGANPMILANQLITAYVDANVPKNDRAHWNYTQDSPLRDARGFDLARGFADGICQVE